MEGDDIDPLTMIVPCADILILSGDIGSLYKYKQLYNFLRKLATYFTHIVYVPGNHEFYKPRDMKIKPVAFDKLNDVLRILDDQIENLHVLNCSSLLIGNVCIMGCTLWSDIKCDLPKYIVRIHDLDTHSYKALHDNHVRYIKEMIPYCKQHNYRVICVTHHPPTFDVINMANRKQKFVSLYASHLDHLISRENMHTWIFGHVHKNFDLLVNGCRLVCNQKGRIRDNITDFNNCFTL